MSASLASLEWIPYISDRGLLPEQFQGKVGVYAIFDQDQALQYIGFWRDVYLSLKQHLVRQPQLCHWVKVQTIERPSRSALEDIRTAWVTENGTTPNGNATDEARWTQPIDIRTQMTEEERHNLDAAIDDLAQSKVLKQIARRVESELLEILKQRGVQEEIRFQPKMKEEGLLDLK